MEAQQQLVMVGLELDDSQGLPYLDLLIHMVKKANDYFACALTWAREG